MIKLCWLQSSVCKHFYTLCRLLSCRSLARGIHSQKMFLSCVISPGRIAILAVTYKSVRISVYVYVFVVIGKNPEGSAIAPTWGWALKHCTEFRPAWPTMSSVLMMFRDFGSIFAELNIMFWFVDSVPYIVRRRRCNTTAPLTTWPMTLRHNVEISHAWPASAMEPSMVKTVAHHVAIYYKIIILMSAPILFMPVAVLGQTPVSTHFFCSGFGSAQSYVGL